MNLLELELQKHCYKRLSTLMEMLYISQSNTL